MADLKQARRRSGGSSEPRPGNSGNRFPGAQRAPVLREVPHQPQSDGGAKDPAPPPNHPACVTDGEASPESFWGHYVHDRLRHFSPGSR